MDGCFFVDLLAIFRRWFYVVGVQIISSHIVHETNQEEEIKKWLSLNRARNTNVVNKAHNRHQNNFPKSSYLGVALAHTMRGGERAHFAILSLHSLPSFRSLGRSVSAYLFLFFRQQFSNVTAIYAKSSVFVRVGFVQRRRRHSLALQSPYPSVRRSCGSIIIVIAQTHTHTLLQ